MELRFVSTLQFVQDVRALGVHRVVVAVSGSVEAKPVLAELGDVVRLEVLGDRLGNGPSDFYRAETGGVIRCHP